MASSRLNFLLPAVIDSGESIFFTFECEQLHKNLAKFEIASLHIYWHQVKLFNFKKGDKNLV
jgi:hypothetical protein